MAKRNGLRRPQAKVSWHFSPVAASPVRQLAVPAPRNGLSAGTPPSRVILRIFPERVFWLRDAWFAPAQPKGLR